MDVSEDEVVPGSRKRVGKLGSDPVVQVTLKGGLNLVFARVNGKISAIGAGSHPAIARHLAKKKHQDIVWQYLNKSEYVPENAFQHLLPKYQLITEQYDRALQKRQR